MANNFNFELGSKKYIMGILNITPDSFFDGGKYFDVDLAVERAMEIQNQGADILDIGAQSTRPGCKKIPVDVELRRLIPVVKKLSGKIKIPISIDTFYYDVAEKMLDMGIDIINDVSGQINKKILDILSNSNCGYILVHNSKMLNIKRFFIENLDIIKSCGISPNRICMDVGIGFGKSVEDNIYILSNVKNFKVKGQAMLVGASRKSVIGHLVNSVTPMDRLIGTISAHTISALDGADILRVHDVKEAKQSMMVVESILKNRKS